MDKSTITSSLKLKSEDLTSIGTSQSSPLLTPTVVEDISTLSETASQRSKRQVDETFEEAVERLYGFGTEASSKKPKGGKSADLMKFLDANDVYSIQIWDALPKALKLGFMTIPNLQSLLTTTIQMLNVRRP
eukprot:Selendium_serpulae@DN11223_c0_g1_i1.p1